MLCVSSDFLHTIGASMNRIDQVKTIVNQILSGVKNVSDQQNAAIHLYGVSSFCSLLSLRRGLDPEIAAISGLQHDVYAYRVGTYDFHPQNGADMVRVILRKMDCFDEAEKRIIQSAIFHHANKDIVHDEYDEILKDADILQPFLHNGGGKVSHLIKPRLERMVKELRLSVDFTSLETYGNTTPLQIDELTDKRGRLADIAESLAVKQITGDKSNPDYMNVIRYWPEDDAFDELKNGWCAAFVYHCCQEAGFFMPIRWKPSDHWRFACVAAWNVWAREDMTDFFITDAPGFTPQRGDIVLYRNIIPNVNKPLTQSTYPIDHIGIVLGHDGEKFTVAEGNIDNQNKSGILSRLLHQSIEGYIRIDNRFIYNGWKYDYKTGTERVDRIK